MEKSGKGKKERDKERELRKLKRNIETGRLIKVKELVQDTNK